MAESDLVWLLALVAVAGFIWLVSIKETDPDDPHGGDDGWP